MSIGFTEILLIIVFVVVVFGAKRIPELARALGRAAYEYKKAKSEIAKEAENVIKDSEKKSEDGKNSEK